MENPNLPLIKEPVLPRAQKIYPDAVLKRHSSDLPVQLKVNIYSPAAVVLLLHLNREILQTPGNSVSAGASVSVVLPSRILQPAHPWPVTPWGVRT